MLVNLLNNICEVQRLTTTQNTMGAQKRVYTIRISSMKIAYMQRRERNTGDDELFDKSTTRYTHIFYAEFNSTNNAITESDKIIFEGREFEVNKIYNASGRNNHLEIEAEELK